jgi:hypothetical protein
MRCINARDDVDVWNDVATSALKAVRQASAHPIVRRVLPAIERHILATA